jgi:hypothetical protein
MGGTFIKEYSVAVSKTKSAEEKNNFTLPVSNLCAPADGGSFPELHLAFDTMPYAGADETHLFQIRASNTGGWSEWSVSFETTAIARQQGADEAQALLIKAIASRRIERLARVLEDVRDIEFSDESHVIEATDLLQKLTGAKTELNQAMAARDPIPLRTAIDAAKAVQLPDLEKAESLLAKLEGTVLQLDNAKGIDALKRALQTAKEAKLPGGLLAKAFHELTARVAAQSGLEDAMEARRVPGLTTALEKCVGMNLPSEEPGKKLLGALQQAESQLRKALTSGLISHLNSALKAVDESGLREEELVGEAQELLTKLRAEQEKSTKQLRAGMQARHPEKLRNALVAARSAQVLNAEIQEADQLLKHLERLLKEVVDAEGVQARSASLAAATSAELTQVLLQDAKGQLARLKALLAALKMGDVEELRRRLRDADASGVKNIELIEARVVYQEWASASHDVDVAVAHSQVEPLRRALSAAATAGISQEQLAAATELLASMEKRDAAEARLRECVAAHKLEQLQKALKQACDMDVADCPLIDEAHTLIEHLQRSRTDLHTAVDLAELHTLFGTLQRVRCHPALPEKELERGEKLLEDLQQTEKKLIEAELASSEDFKDLDELSKRARRSAAAAVHVQEELLAEVAERSLKAQEAVRWKLEQELQQQRSEHKFPRWMHTVPHSTEAVELPNAVVFGKFKVFFEPSGNYMCTLPREIVEGTLQVLRSEVPTDHGCPEDMMGSMPLRKQFTKAIRKLLDPKDDILELNDNPTHSRNRRNSCIDAWEMHLAIYVRAPHSGVQVAEALCRESSLACDLWDDELEVDIAQKNCH